MKKFNWIAVAALSLGVVAADLSAQDSRERNYYYEILNPSHEPKSPVNGFAGTRVSEVLDRGDLLEDLIKTGGVGHGVGAVRQILLDTLLPALVADEPVEAVSLYTQQVGYINGLADGAEVHTVRRLVQINIVLVGACDDGGGVRRSLSQWTFLIAR